MKILKSMVIIGAISLFGLCSESSATVEENITLKINNQIVDTDVEPQIHNDRVLVPVRIIAEELGANVDWLPMHQRIHIYANFLSVRLRVGSNYAIVDDEVLELDTAPVIFNNRTLVPVRFVSESLGANVQWDSENRQVVVNKVTHPVLK